MKLETLSFSKAKGFGLLQFQTNDADSFGYIGSDHAINEKYVIVKEINNEGSVNNLIVENNSPHFVFFMDGDVLVGAKQNRVLNTSVLIAPNSKTKITVSCIEQGRWKNKSATFSNSEYSVPARLRKSKNIRVKDSLKSTKSYYANQSEVWSEINSYEKDYKFYSNTMDLNELMKSNENNFKNFIDDFHVDNKANGIAMFNKDKLLNIEVFNKTDIYKVYFKKMLHSTAMELFNLDNPESKMQKDDAEDLLIHELNKLEKYHSIDFPGLGVGTEKRYDTYEFSCHLLSFEGKLIHFAYLNL